MQQPSADGRPQPTACRLLGPKPHTGPKPKPAMVLGAAPGGSAPKADAPAPSQGGATAPPPLPAPAGPVPSLGQVRVSTRPQPLHRRCTVLISTPRAGARLCCTVRLQLASARAAGAAASIERSIDLPATGPEVGIAALWDAVVGASAAHARNLRGTPPTFRAQWGRPQSSRAAVRASAPEWCSWLARSTPRLIPSVSACSQVSRAWEAQHSPRLALSAGFRCQTARPVRPERRVRRWPAEERRPGAGTVMSDLSVAQMALPPSNRPTY